MRPLATAPPTIPDYELLCRIGAGAYGEVWLGRNTATQAERAVKIVHRATFADERPFLREFEGIKRFDAVSRSHPTQLTLFHVGRDDGFFYYVMELADPLPGSAEYQPHTLRADLGNGRLSAAEVLALGLALAEALHHLHAAGLVHRDVKPSNIIYVHGKPKLADIGLVTDASDSQSIVGTEGYLPREGPGTPAADLFALGKVLYEALTGLDRRQFPELPGDLRDWPDARLAFELNTIVLKLCADLPAQSYSTAATLIADLQHLGCGKSVQRRRFLQRAGRICLKSAAALALAASVFWISQPEKQPDPDAFENSGTTNFAAFQAVNVAIQMAAPYTVQTLSNSVRELERAVELDPNYGTAWGILALCLSLAVDYGYLNGSQTLPRAQSYVEKAIGLKPTRSQNYCTLAEIRLGLDYDFPAIEPVYRKGLAGLPPTSNNHHNFARILVYYGRLAEAEEILREILSKDPGRGGSYILLGQIYGASGRIEEALAAYQKAAPTSNRPYLYFNRADLLFSRNDRLAAASDLLRFVELHGFASLDPLNEGAELRRILNESGPEEFLRRHIQLLEERRGSGQFVSTYDLARLHMHSGNLDQAIDYLQLAVGEHRQMTLAVKVNPLFKPLHGDPRFQAVLSQLRLE